jgi:hypothetical protein
MRWQADSDLRALVDRQHGALSRPQVLACGRTDAGIRVELAAGRWQQGLPGVYVTYTGVQQPKTRLWVALLYAGEGATASHQSAAWLQGLADDPSGTVHVTVPSRRTVAPQPGVVVHGSTWVDQRRHPPADPPRTRVEDTVLDLSDAAARPQEVVDLVTRACQRRLTTAERLRLSAEQRKRLGWRELLMDVLAEVSDGVHSELERRYARDVERAHGLPKGERNVAEDQNGKTVYRDVRHRRERVVVELDGRAAHPEERRHLDRARDRHLAARDVVTVRYGWREVVGDPCAVAAEMAALLRSRGWDGRPRPCGPGCPVARWSTPAA